MIVRFRWPLLLVALLTFMAENAISSAASFQETKDKKDKTEPTKDAKPKDDKATAEKPKSDLEGTWEVTKADENGESQVGLLKAKFTFKDNKLTVQIEKETIPFTFKTDAAKMPKTIDVEEALVKEAKETSLGIYEISGDVLKLCMAEAELKERPTELKSAKKKVIYLEFKKDKS